MTVAIKFGKLAITMPGDATELKEFRVELYAWNTGRCYVKLISGRTTVRSKWHKSVPDALDEVIRPLTGPDLFYSVWWDAHTSQG